MNIQNYFIDELDGFYPDEVSDLNEQLSDWFWTENEDISVDNILLNRNRIIEQYK